MDVNIIMNKLKQVFPEHSFESERILVEDPIGSKAVSKYSLKIDGEDSKILWSTFEELDTTNVSLMKGVQDTLADAMANEVKIYLGHKIEAGKL